MLPQQKLAWQKAIRENALQGFTYTVAVKANCGFQLHSFYNIESATEFYNMCRSNPDHLSEPKEPKTIAETLKDFR